MNGSISAYHVCDQGRLTRVRELLKGYSTGGQKSVYECFLSDSELRRVASELRRLIEADEDRASTSSPWMAEAGHTSSG